MMHHRSVKTAEGELTVNFNSDWSGRVEVAWHPEDVHGEIRRMWVPGDALRKLAELIALQPTGSNE